MRPRDSWEGAPARPPPLWAVPAQGLALSQFPSPGEKVVLKYPRSTHHTHLALGGQCGASHSPSGVMAALDPWLVRGQSPGLPVRGPQAAVTPPLTLSPRKARGSLRQGRGVRWQLLLWPRARSMSMLHAAPSPWPTTSTCFLHNYVRGSWGTVLQEPLFGWGARRASLSPGSLRGPGARLSAFLRLRFPRVN